MSQQLTKKIDLFIELNNTNFLKELKNENNYYLTCFFSYLKICKKSKKPYYLNGETVLNIFGEPLFFSLEGLNFNPYTLPDFNDNNSLKFKYMMLSNYLLCHNEEK